jgi:nucleoside-diphosphate-sugar epimerase
MSDDDSKVIDQFIRNVCNNKPIVLKSKGTQQYSYCYVADICYALLLLLLQGENGEAYNIAYPKNKETLLEIVGILSEYTHTKVVFEIPSIIESTGCSKATRALLDGDKSGDLAGNQSISLKTDFSKQ